jgi:hypothetical protein
VTTTRDDYAKALGNLKQTLAKKGDLDGVLAVQAEEKRFSKVQAVPNDVIVQTPVELKALQLIPLKKCAWTLGARPGGTRDAGMGIE